MLKINKVITIAFLFSAFCVNIVRAQTDEFFGIGAKLTQDSFNKKTIIVGLIDNSPAQKAGMNIGSQIIAVDDVKVKKMCICEIVSRIRGEENTNVKITVKKGLFKKQTYELTRTKIILENNTDSKFETHWVQIAPSCYKDAEIIPLEALKKFSRKFQKTEASKIEYWSKRKEDFKTGYDACKNYSNKNNQEICLIHLLDRESAKTNTDKTLYKYLQQE